MDECRFKISLRGADGEDESLLQQMQMAAEPFFKAALTLMDQYVNEEYILTFMIRPSILETPQ